MLVLSRRLGESIKIGDDIEVVVLEIRGKMVRLGISAPKDVPIHRREIYDAIHREQLVPLSVAASHREASKSFEEPHETEGVAK